MKTAKVLTPILMLVLVLCMLALTFAWFSAGQDSTAFTTLTAGSYVKVVFDDSGVLNNEKYNGQKGYDDNGTAYTDDDKAYEAYYHTSIKLQGDSDLYLRLEFTELYIKVSPTFYMLGAQRTLDEIISVFDGYDEGKSHIGKAETVVTENGEETVFTDPADGSTAFVYTDDGTADGKVICLRLDKVNADKFFTLNYAKITTTSPPYTYGTFADEGEGLHFVHGDNLPAGTSEVVSDATYGKSNPVCIKITYSDATYAKTFPFSGDSFKGSEFIFEVVAYANTN